MIDGYHTKVTTQRTTKEKVVLGHLRDKYGRDIANRCIDCEHRNKSFCGLGLQDIGRIPTLKCDMSGSPLPKFDWDDLGALARWRMGLEE